MKTIKILTILVLAVGVVDWMPTVRAHVIFNESFETNGQGTRYTASTPFIKASHSIMVATGSGK